MKLAQRLNVIAHIALKISKRKRVIIATVCLTFIILLSSFFSLDQAEYFLALLIALVYFFTYFAVLEEIDRVEWVMLFLMPVYFTIVFYLFYFLLPVRWLTRLPYIMLYAVSMYALLLSANIFNIGVTKNLHLFRAAFSVNYLYLTITSFFIFNLILSFKLSFIVNFVMYFCAIFPLALQFIWTINPRIDFAPHIRRYAFLIALIIAEAGTILSFMPVKSTISALFMSSLFYGLCGLFQAFIENMLFRERIREYVFVIVFVLIIVILATQWV